MLKQILKEPINLYMKVIMNQMGYLLAGVSRTKPIWQKEVRGVHNLGQQSWATRLFNNLEECRTILGNNLGQQSWTTILGNNLGQQSWATILASKLGQLSVCFYGFVVI